MDDGVLSWAFEGARSFVELGGPVVGILLVLSVISMAVIMFKLVQFFLHRVGRPKRAERAIALWHAGQPGPALNDAQQGRSATARTVAKAMALVASPLSKKSTPADIEDAVSLEASVRLHDLRSGFRLLDSVAQIAPLLGLFGTVLGMIEAFQKLQGAGSSVDPSILAGGIWVALLTTAVGLAVAMPTSLALSFLESRLEDERVAIERLASEILSPFTMSGHATPKHEEGRVPMAALQPVAG